MRPRTHLALLIALALCRCVAPPGTLLVAPLPAPEVPAVVPHPAPVVAPPVAKLVRHFDRQAARELTVATDGQISLEQLDAIREADARARHALARLGRMRAQPSRAVLDAAVGAVRGLERTLDEIVTDTSD